MEHTKTELKALNDKLEQIVAERTEALEAINEALQHEIAKRERVEEAVREAEAKYRTLVEQVPAIIYIGALDQASSTLYISPQVEQMLGFAADEWIQDPDLWAKQLHPDDRERVLAEVAHSHASGEPLRSEYRLMARDGHTVWVRDEAVLVRDEASRPLVLQGIMLDITQQKQVEEERQTYLWFLESMDRVSRAMQGTNDLEQMMSDVLDTVLSIFDCDRAYLLYPCDPEAASWNVPMERTRPEYPGVLALGQEIPMGKDLAETFRILLTSSHPVKFGPGAKHPLQTEVAEQFSIKSLMTTALYPKVGKPWQFGIHQCSYPRTWTPEEERLLQGIGQRLTDALTSLLAHRNLQESELRYRELFEESSECIFLLDVTEDGRFKFAEFNPAEERAVGLSNAEVSGKFVEEAISPELAQQVTANYRRCVETGTLINYDEELNLPIGCRAFHTNLIPVRNAAGDIYRIVGVARDITERKRVQSIMQARLRLLEFAGSHSMDELLTATLDEIEALAGSTIGFYHFLESDQKTLSLQNWSTNTLKNLCTAEGKGSHYDIAQAGVWVDCINERRPVIHNDYASLSHRKGLPDGHAPVTREVVVPIFRGNLIKAIIGVGNKPIPYNENDIEIVSQLGDLSWDIAERKRAEEALEKQYSTLRGIIDSANALVFSVDRQYHYTSFNQGHAAVMKALYGAEIEIGHSLLEYMTVTEDRETAQYNLDRALAGEQLVEEAYSGEEPRSRRYFQVSHSPLKTETGEIIGVAVLAQDMTERREMEQALAVREKEYRTLVEHSPDLIVRYDTDLRRIYMNPTWEKASGLSAQEVINVRAADIPKVPSPTVPEYTEKLRETLKTGSPQSIEFSWVNARGDTLFLEYVIVPEYDQYGEIASLLAVGRDLTERKRAEADLRKLSQAVEQSPTSIIVTDAAGDIEYVNPKFTRVTGYTRDEVLGKNPRILKSGETPPAEYRRLWDTITHGGVWHGEFHNKKKNGELYWESASISPVFDSQGNIRHFIAVKEDITGRKRAEDALRDSEARYRAIVEAFDGLIYICSQDYRVEFMNRKLIERTGYDGTGKLCYKVLHDIDTMCPWCVNERVFSDEIVRWEVQSPKDGRWYYVVNTPIHHADGSISKQAMIQDITERKQRERELEALVTMATALRAALTRDEVLRIVADQVFGLLRSGGVALLLRYSEAEELLVMTARGAWEHWIDVRLPSGEGISGYVVSIGEPYVSDDVRTDALLYRPDLTGNLHAVACVPLIAKDEVIGVLWAGQQTPIEPHDVRLLKTVADMAATAIRRAILHEQTQRHAAELEERVTERTRELAEANARLLELDQLKTKFVSDVSHELRTPITSLQLHLDLLMHGRPEKREAYTTVLKQQANRLTRLVEDILDLSRLELGGGEIAFAPVDLNQLVDQVVAAHQPIAENADLRLTFEPGHGLPPVKGEVNQLAQVVTNLVNNALNYTPAGSVRVRTYLEGDRVCLEVEDTGMGIDTEDLPHLFERFYRGKGVSEGGTPGTGLGLAIVKEIVDLHKGSIDIDSQPGKGTTFTVRLPFVG